MSISGTRIRENVSTTSWKVPAGVSVALVLLIGGLDYITGFEIRLFPLYVMPILAAVWYSGRALGLLLSGVALVMWTVVNLSHGTFNENLWIAVGNNLIRYALCVFVVFSAGAFRFQFDAQRRDVESLRRFEVLARIAPVGIFRTDAEGNLLYVNSEWCSIFERTPEESVGRPWTLPLGPENEAVSQWRSAKGPVQFETRVKQPNGTTTWIAGRLASEFQGGGQAPGIVGIISNVTDHRRLEREVLEISEREQHRIGQDVHDGLCQSLAAIKLTVGSLKSSLSQKAPSEIARVEDILALLKNAITETRKVARGILPIKLTEEGLVAALAELVGSVPARHGVVCSFSSSSEIDVESAAAGHLYRIAQEALNNVLKHSHATEAEISLFVENGRLSVAIRDNGIGFATAGAASGMGLYIMGYRAKMIGAELNVTSSLGGGTLIVCSLADTCLKMPETGSKSSTPYVLPG